MGRCAARPAVRGGAPSLSSVAELVGGCVTTGGSRGDSSPRASRRACPTSAGTRCDGRRRLPLQPLLQRPSLPVHGLDPIPQRVVPSGGAAREAAAGTPGSICGFPSSCAESTDLADVLVSVKRSDVLAPAEGLPPSTAHIVGFAHGIRILLFARVGVYCRFVNGTASATRAPCGQSP